MKELEEENRRLQKLSSINKMYSTETASKNCIKYLSKDLTIESLKSSIHARFKDCLVIINKWSDFSDQEQTYLISDVNVLKINFISPKKVLELTYST